MIISEAGEEGALNCKIVLERLDRVSPDFTREEKGRHEIRPLVINNYSRRNRSRRHRTRSHNRTLRAE